MEVITMIFAAVAIAVAVAAYVRAGKKVVTERVVEKETIKTVSAPAEHPFVYDEGENAYTLNGNLKVTGEISALEKGKE